MREETLYVSLLPGSGVLPEPGQYETREMVAQGAQSDGYSARWVGRSMGPRIQMETDLLIRDPEAAEFERFSRMYGLVAGEMLWANERQGNDHESHVELSGRLMRVDELEETEQKDGE